MKVRFVRAILAVLAITIIGCDSHTAESTLDQQLNESIAAAGGIEAFYLPASDELDRIPQDPQNPLTTEKVALGRLLFHETALAANPAREEGRGTYSCATCHHASAAFQSGTSQAIGEGGSGHVRRVLDPDYGRDDADIQAIRTLSPLNGAWQMVSFWNGQFGAHDANVGTEARWSASSVVGLNHLGYQGLETQAIAALKTHRMEGGAAAVAAAYPEYKKLFEAAFPGRAVSDETAGLAIAAYERTLIANQAPFQLWMRGDSDALTDAEKRGALVFLGSGNCLVCHKGPALGSSTFHALGMGDLEGPFKPYDLADPVHIGRAGFTDRTEDHFRFRTPQLYNVADNSGLGHGATFASIRELVEYKNAAIPENRFISEGQLSPQFHPLGLDAQEIDDLTAFLERALYDPNLRRYEPQAVPSGQCFPSNDALSRKQLGCQSAH